MKINEVIVESQLKEFGVKDLAKGWKQGTLGKSIGQGINKAAKGVASAGQSFGQSVKDAGQMAQDVLPGTSAYVKSFGGAGNRLAKQFVGKDPNTPWLDKNAAPGATPSYASYGDDYKPSHNGEIFVVRAHGNEYFKSYTDRWYQKPSNLPNDYSVTHPIDAYKDYAVLDKILQQGDYEVVEVKKDPMGDTRFIATKRRPANDDAQAGAGIVDQNGNPL